jgi:hypothetical protein
VETLSGEGLSEARILRAAFEVDGAAPMRAVLEEPA